MALTSQVMPTDIKIYVEPGVIVVGTVFYVCQLGGGGTHSEFGIEKYSFNFGVRPTILLIAM
jgi:hypothetical protein